MYIPKCKMSSVEVPAGHDREKHLVYESTLPSRPWIHLTIQTG